MVVSFSLKLELSYDLMSKPCFSRDNMVPVSSECESGIPSLHSNMSLHLWQRERDRERLSGEFLFLSRTEDYCNTNLIQRLLITKQSSLPAIKSGFVIIRIGNHFMSFWECFHLEIQILDNRNLQGDGWWSIQKIIVFQDETFPFTYIIVGKLNI